MTLVALANPSRFLRMADLAIPWLGGATLLVFAFGIAQAIIAPDDYQQGATVKIMFCTSLRRGSAVCAGA